MEKRKSYYRKPFESSAKNRNEAVIGEVVIIRRKTFLVRH